MKTKILLFFIVVGISLFSACSDDTEYLSSAPKVGFKESDTINIAMEDSLIISPIVVYGEPMTQTWTIDGTLVSEEFVLRYKFTKAGIHNLSYTAENKVGQFDKQFRILVDPPIRPSDSISNMYVTKLFEYNPAPGQFINVSVGNYASAEGILGKQGLVTLGAWGGYAVYGFDHTVKNRPEQDDIIVYGNAMTNFAEPGIVYVMQDENGNGLPDDTWYELAGSEFGKNTYKRNYSVTYYRPASASDDVSWKDSEGKEGVVKKNAFHRQAYYPEWITEDSYTLKGSILTGNINDSNPSFITSSPYAWGYSDSTPGGDKFNISNAVDANGNKVNLKGIDFIKVQTGVIGDMGWLGEVSTEVAGIVDISLMK